MQSEVIGRLRERLDTLYKAARMAPLTADQHVGLQVQVQTAKADLEQLENQLTAVASPSADPPDEEPESLKNKSNPQG